MTAELAADTGDTLGESPWWDVRDECLWWVDLRAPALHRLFPATGAITSWPMPGLAGAVVGRQAGGVALALQDGVYAFCPDSHVLRRLAPIQWDQPDMRLNDAKCGPDGVLWFGAMRDFGRDDSGGLYCLHPGGAPRKLRGGVRVPNAIALTPDGHSLYFCDTRAGVIERGTIVGPDVSFQLFSDAAAPGAPDGATLDAEGFLWNARYGGAALARFAPDGRLDRLAPLPVTNPTSCAFGGPDLRTLYVTTARQGLDEATLAREPLAGGLLALDVGVAGVAEHAFGG